MISVLAIVFDPVIFLPAIAAGIWIPTAGGRFLICLFAAAIAVAILSSAHPFSLGIFAVLIRVAVGFAISMIAGWFAKVWKTLPGPK